MGPFSLTPPSEVPLERAPLTYVVAQVRFPVILKINERDFVAGFQEALRSEYPILRQEQTQGFIFTPDGVGRAPSDTTWRFVSIDELWKVSLAPNFVSLETTAYIQRNQFSDRFQSVLAALQEKIDQKLFDRVGVRYVNRFVDDEVVDIGKIIRPELMGMLNLPIGTDGRVLHQLSEMTADVPPSRLSARWGTLPPGQTTDPSALPPINKNSWILDIDSFFEGMLTGGSDEAVVLLRSLSEKAYTFFRWAVSEDFINERAETK